MNKIKKILNDGTQLRDEKRVVTFLTTKGYRTPQYIWVGYSNDNIELCDTTKKGVIDKIERDNRIFSKI